MPAMKTALLVIDVQQRLCQGEEDSYDSPGLIDRINTAADRARAAGATVVFIQHEGRNGYLERGTDDWQLARGLRSAPSDLFIGKTTPDAFNSTPLERTLRERGVEELVVCGMHSEFCVDTTVRRALALGFPVVIVADGHTTRGKEHLSAAQIIRHENATLTDITSFGPRARAVPAAELHFQAS